MKLTSNQLKVLAMVTMTLDHIGVQLFPGVLWLRVAGRLAMPIYAWMIAEGCAHTRDRRRYLLRLAGLALLCQLVYFFAMGSLFQCILVTFSLSVILIFAIDSDSPAKAVCALCAALCVTDLLPRLLSGTDFAVDYGIWGVLLPVAVYLARTRRQKLLAAAVLLSLLAVDMGGVQWFGLAALLPLSLYSGARGNARIKWLFYLYYPLHLAVIYGISLIL
ncbi:MAG: hypothetical protein IJA84_05280 [Clostridia bacterium]|nr:hypothetical protein [Clostridia bacterium]